MAWTCRQQCCLGWSHFRWGHFARPPNLFIATVNHACNACLSCCIRADIAINLPSVNYRNLNSSFKSSAGRLTSSKAAHESHNLWHCCLNSPEYWLQLAQDWTAWYHSTGLAFPQSLVLYDIEGLQMGFYGIVGESADSFCERCVREAGVLLLPGSQFDHEPSDDFSNSFRIGFGRHNLPQCMKQLESWLDG